MIVDRPRALGHVLDSWRNSPSSSASPTEILRQLRVANPDVGSPVLVLGFDGLDEVPDSERGEAEQLIRHFHKMHVELHSSQVEPDGLLIVTCRNKEDLDDVVASRGYRWPHSARDSLDQNRRVLRRRIRGDLGALVSRRTPAATRTA